MRSHEQKIYILRCCRDWPVHYAEGVAGRGSCGLCGLAPKFILEEYVKDQGVSLVLDV